MVCCLLHFYVVCYMFVTMGNKHCWGTNVSQQCNLPSAVSRGYITHHSKIPRFYHLIKTHKENPSVKIRPIVANCQGPTRKLSWLLQKLLCPLMDTVSTHLRNSAQLMEEISNIDRGLLVEHSYPFSLDVNNLYTSIPVPDAVEAICEYIEEHKEVHIPLRTDYLKDLLRAVLMNTYFTFNNAIYQQVHGLPMGSSVSGTLAIIFLFRLEIRTIRTMPIVLYRRYIDDVCLITTNREEAIRIRDLMNQQHPSIRFDIEHPVDGRTLQLLDFEFTITSEGTTKYNFYKKKVKKPIFVHQQSALPSRMKIQVIKNEIRRIHTRCTDPIDALSNLNAFSEVLTSNGYSANSVLAYERNGGRRRTRKPQANVVEPVYLRLPFVSDGMDGKIRRIIRKYDLPIRIYHKPKTLRRMLQLKCEKSVCNLKSCPLNDSSKCDVRNCVYELKCHQCSGSYIGSTIRPLHLRIREHLQSSNSSVFKHKTICGSVFTTKILGRCADLTSLRILEALKIKENQPIINSRQEREELGDLVF